MQSLKLGAITWVLVIISVADASINQGNSKANVQTCFLCNGIENSICSSIPDESKIVTCAEYSRTCLTGIDRLGYTHRSCSNSTQNETTDEDQAMYPNGLDICTESNCNNKIFPSNRLQCYQCSGGETCAFVESSTEQMVESQPCSIFSKLDQCYTYISTKDRNLYRGCLSDANSRLMCDDGYVNQTGVCVKCQKSACNSQPKHRAPTQLCIECAGYEECSFGHTASHATKCSKKVLFGVDETCFIRFNPDSGHTVRGCTLDARRNPNWCNQTDGCETCFDFGCNTRNVQYHECLRCDSEITDNCASLNDPYEFVESCSSATYSYKERGCYTMNKDGFIIRGCVDELIESESAACRSDGSCKICQENICNIENIAAIKTTTSASIFVSVVIFQVLHHIKSISSE